MSSVGLNLPIFCVHAANVSRPPNSLCQRERSAGAHQDLRREELAQVAGIGSDLVHQTGAGTRDPGFGPGTGEPGACAPTDARRAHASVCFWPRTVPPLPTQRHTPRMSEDLQCLLDALDQHPAFVVNERWDIVGWNQAASQVFGHFGAFSDWERNLVWILFTQPDQRTLYTDWKAGRSGRSPFFAQVAGATSVRAGFLSVVSA